MSAVDASGAACPGTSLGTKTRAQVQAAVFQELSPTVVTVGSMFQRCTFGGAKLNTSNSAVTAVTTLPCSGTRWERIPGSSAREAAAAGGGVGAASRKVPAAGSRNLLRDCWERHCLAAAWRPPPLRLVPRRTTAPPRRTSPPRTTRACPPCSSEGAWTFSRCEFADMDGTAEAAEAKLRAQGINVDAYFYR